MNEIKAEGQQAKRKPGRPKGSKSHVNAAGNPSVSTTNASGFGSGSPSAISSSVPGANSGTLLAPTMLSSGIPKEAIRNTLEIPFAIAAASTGFPGFKLETTESDSIVPLLDHCIVQYMPALAGPHATAWMLTAALLGLAGSKYLAFEKFKREIATKEKSVQ